MNTFSRRIFALCLSLVYFVSTHLSYAASEPYFSATPAAQATPLNPASIRIPENLGQVRFFGVGSGKQIVVLIEDGHSIPAVQEKISGLIEYLTSTYGIKLVTAEGASGVLDAQFLKSFPDSERLNRVLEEYLKAGELTGVNAAAIRTQTNTNFVGIENVNLYEEGLIRYHKVLLLQKKFKLLLNRRKAALAEKKKKVYSKELLAIDRAVADLEEGKTGLKELLTSLSQFNAPSPESELFHLLKLIEAPPDDTLKKQMERLTKKFKGTHLCEELNSYFQNTKSQFIRSSAERKLNEKSETLNLLTKLAALELSREEWEKVKNLGFQILDFGLDDSLSFYQNAEARENALFENLLKFLGASEQSLPVGQTGAILVAGGFHTEGIKEQLKKNGISYLVIQPKIDKLPTEDIYRKQMAGGMSWKNYYRVRNGQINVYDAFMRSARDQLLGLEGVARPQFLKLWREQIIRDLANQGRVTEHRQYTKFLGRSKESEFSHALRKQLFSKAEHFIANLRSLDQKDALTEQNILKLFKPATIVSTSSLALSPKVMLSASTLYGSGVKRETTEMLGHSELRTENQEPKPGPPLELKPESGSEKPRIRDFEIPPSSNFDTALQKILSEVQNESAKDKNLRFVPYITISHSAHAEALGELGMTGVQGRNQVLHDFLSALAAHLDRLEKQLSGSVDWDLDKSDALVTLDFKNSPFQFRGYSFSEITFKCFNSGTFSKKFLNTFYSTENISERWRLFHEFLNSGTIVLDDSVRVPFVFEIPTQAAKLKMLQHFSRLDLSEIIWFRGELTEHEMRVRQKQALELAAIQQERKKAEQKLKDEEREKQRLERAAQKRAQLERTNEHNKNLAKWKTFKRVGTAIFYSGIFGFIFYVWHLALGWMGGEIVRRASAAERLRQGTQQPAARSTVAKKSVITQAHLDLLTALARKIEMHIYLGGKSKGELSIIQYRDEILKMLSQFNRDLRLSESWLPDQEPMVSNYRVDLANLKSGKHGFQANKFLLQTLLNQLGATMFKIINAENNLIAQGGNTDGPTEGAKILGVDIAKLKKLETALMLITGAHLVKDAHIAWLARDPRFVKDYEHLGQIFEEFRKLEQEKRSNPESFKNDVQKSQTHLNLAKQIVWHALELQSLGHQAMAKFLHNGNFSTKALEAIKENYLSSTQGTEELTRAEDPFLIWLDQFLKLYEVLMAHETETQDDWLFFVKISLFECLNKVFKTFPQESNVDKAESAALERIAFEVVDNSTKPKFEFLKEKVLRGSEKAGPRQELRSINPEKRGLSAKEWDGSSYLFATELKELKKRGYQLVVNAIDSNTVQVTVREPRHTDGLSVKLFINDADYAHFSEQLGWNLSSFFNLGNEINGPTASNLYDELTNAFEMFVNQLETRQELRVTSPKLKRNSKIKWPRTIVIRHEDFVLGLYPGVFWDGKREMTGEYIRTQTDEKIHDHYFISQGAVFTIYRKNGNESWTKLNTPPEENDFTSPVEISSPSTWRALGDFSKKYFSGILDPYAEFHEAWTLHQFLKTYFQENPAPEWKQERRNAGHKTHDLEYGVSVDFTENGEAYIQMNEGGYFALHYDGLDESSFLRKIVNGNQNHGFEWVPLSDFPMMDRNGRINKSRAITWLEMLQIRKITALLLRHLGFEVPDMEGRSFSKALDEMVKQHQSKQAEKNGNKQLFLAVEYSRRMKAIEDSGRVGFSKDERTLDAYENMIRFFEENSQLLIGVEAAFYYLTASYLFGRVDTRTVLKLFGILKNLEKDDDFAHRIFSSIDFIKLYWIAMALDLETTSRWSSRNQSLSPTQFLEAEILKHTGFRIQFESAVIREPESAASFFEEIWQGAMSGIKFLEHKGKLIQALSAAESLLNYLEPWMQEIKGEDHQAITNLDTAQDSVLDAIGRIQKKMQSSPMPKPRSIHAELRTQFTNEQSRGNQMMADAAPRQLIPLVQMVFHSLDEARSAKQLDQFAQEVRHEIRMIGIERFEREFFAAANQEIERILARQEFVSKEAAQIFLNYLTQVLSDSSLQNSALTVAVQVNTEDGAHALRNYAEALLKTRGALEAVIFSGDTHQLGRFRKPMKEARISVATVQNLDSVRKTRLSKNQKYLPVIRKEHKGLLRSPILVAIDVNHGKENSFDPILETVESALQVTLAILVASKVNSAELIRKLIPSLLMQSMIQFDARGTITINRPILKIYLSQQSRQKLKVAA